MAGKPARKKSSGGQGGSGGTTHWALAIPLAVAAGCLVFLSFPTWDIFPLQWISLIPLAIAVRGRGGWGGFGLGFLAGLATNVGGFHWMNYLLSEFGHMGPIASNAIMVLMAAYQGLTFAVGSGLSSAVASRLSWATWTAVFPFVFTAIEHLVPFIFPWYFANGQQLFPAVTQVVEITGVGGLTFLIALVSCALGAVVVARLDGRGFPWKTVVPAAILLVADLAFGVVRIREIDARVAGAPKLSVGMVEADVGIWEKEAKQPDGSPMPVADQVGMLYGNLLKHQYLSAELAAESPDLIVWPESSYIPLREVYGRRTDMTHVAVTADGRVLAIEHGKPRPFGDPSMRVTGLRGVAAAHEELIVAVGPRGAAYLWDGKSWTREPTGVDRDLLAVAVTTEGEALAVGVQGAAAARRGGKWKPVETRTTEDLRAVVRHDDRGFVASGDGGARVAWNGRTATVLPPGEGADAGHLHDAGGGPVPRVEGAVAVAFVPFREGYPLPHDVKWIYGATTPLPPGGMVDIAAAVGADARTAERDRNAPVRGFSAPLLFGAITYEDRPDGDPAYFNTALLIDRDGRVLGRYDKNYLLVFGEYLPFARWFPFLKKWLPESGDFEAGETVEVFRLPHPDHGEVRLGVMVCYEDIIPSFTRRLAGLDPNVLVNVTNDAWFGKTAEPWLHLQLATFRSIENRLYMVRSTNTGVSAIVDPVGRLVRTTSLDGAETVSADVAILSGDTIYRRYGDVFAWACCGIAAILLGVAVARRRS